MLVAQVEESGLGYEWHSGGLLVDGLSGQMFWAAAAGCSCSYFLAYSGCMDMTPVESWQDAVELAKNEFGTEEGARFAEKILSLIDDGQFQPTRAMKGQVAW